MTIKEKKAQIVVYFINNGYFCYQNDNHSNDNTKTTNKNLNGSRKN